MALSAMDDKGNPVDWWFMYKVAGKATTSDGARGTTLNGKKLTGTEYIYFDAKQPSSARLVLSPHTLQDSGALPRTLSQIYGSTNKALGWLFYNDENPITGEVSSERGYTKGVLAFDLSSNTAFWLIQSTPKFPPKGSYAFPRTGMPNAQTLLCITLQNADVAKSIAKQMYVAQQPSVYLASEIPAALAEDPNDPRVKLMNNQVAVGTTPVHVVIPFLSRGGVKLMSIAKNRTWDLDFYNDLVGPTLKENPDVETWEHDPVPPSKDSDKQHTVMDMKSVNLKALGIDLAWTEEDDHAKLAVSARAERSHYVCVGDLNYTIAQHKRGGGIVAFQCEALWASLTSILEGTARFPDAAAAKRSANGSAVQGKTSKKVSPVVDSPGATAQKRAARTAARPPTRTSMVAVNGRRMTTRTARP